MPCGEIMIPSPNDFTRLPFASNLRIAGRLEEPQLLAPQRSATQMLVPSGSMSTALVEPHVRPSGSFAHPSTVRYGFGESLVGWTLACAPAASADVASRTTTRTIERSDRRSFGIGVTP